MEINGICYIQSNLCKISHQAIKEKATEAQDCMLNFEGKKKAVLVWNFKECKIESIRKTLVSLLCPKEGTNKNRKLVVQWQTAAQTTDSQVHLLQAQEWIQDFFLHLAEAQKKLPLGKTNVLPFLQAVVSSAESSPFKCPGYKIQGH